MWRENQQKELYYWLQTQRIVWCCCVTIDLNVLWANCFCCFRPNKYGYFESCFHQLLSTLYNLTQTCTWDRFLHLSDWFTKWQTTPDQMAGSFTGLKVSSSVWEMCHEKCNLFFYFWPLSIYIKCLTTLYPTLRCDVTFGRMQTSCE